MQRLPKCCRRLWLGLGLLGLAMIPVVADEPTDISEEQRAELLSQMKNMATSIHLLADAELADSEVKLVEVPILRYNDSTRDAQQSLLWIWSDGGRPSAVLALNYYPNYLDGTSLLYEIASLSTKRVSVQRESNLKWTAKSPGLDLREIPNTRPPASKAPQRLAQMRELRSRFTANESAVIEGRIELRALSAPLHRYSDTEAGVIDGAIFSFANGTNPEVLLVLESHSHTDADPTWHYSLVQMTGDAVSVELDEKEIWDCKVASPPAVRDSYINGWIEFKDKQ
jgi:hypothetical protein